MARSGTRALAALVVGAAMLSMPALTCRSDRTREPAAPEMASGATKIECDVGERPHYFVPGTPATIVGCARLELSGGDIELSMNPERTAGREHLCVNPAYPGRGSDGLYIPAVCPAEPVGHLAILDHSVPGYYPGVGIRPALVVLGTARARTESVHVGFNEGSAKAAVFSVDRALAREARAHRPFSLFIAELPLVATCKRFSVEQRLAHRAVVKYASRLPNICERASQ